MSALPVTPTYGEHPFVCPDCRGALDEEGEGLACRRCGTRFPVRDGLFCFKLAESSHGEFSRDEMREFLAVAERDGWKTAVQQYAVPRRRNVLPLLSDERRQRLADPLEGGAQSKVLDLGCGYGGLTIQLARRFETVVGIDGSIERVSFLNIVRKQEEINNLSPVAHNDILHLPFPDGYFDAITMVGVFEYFPLSLPNDSVEVAHRKCLSEIRRVLRPGGQLLIATKNRFSAEYLRGGKDHNGLAFGPVLPRKVANTLLRLLKGRPYRIINYSLREYRALLRTNGFSEIRFFWPLNGYQFPDRVIRIERGRRMLDEVDAGYFPEPKRRLFALLDRLGLLSNLIGQFVIVSRKDSR